MKKELSKWNQISGAAKIFANEKEYKKNGKKLTFKAYSTSLSIKVDDEWVNFYINVQFSKDSGVPEDDISDIYINDGFITFDNTDKGKFLKLVILDWQ